METLSNLKIQWQEIVFTYEQEADLAWRNVDIESTDSEGELKYYRKLINTATSYINAK